MFIKSFFDTLDQSFLTGYDPFQKEIQQILARSNRDAMRSDIIKVQKDMIKAFEKLKKELDESPRPEVAKKNHC